MRKAREVAAAGWEKNGEVIHTIDDTWDSLRANHSKVERKKKEGRRRRRRMKGRGGGGGREG